MIFGLAVTGITAGQVLDPYSPPRLVTVTAGVGTIAILLTLAGIWGQEKEAVREPPKRQIDFFEVARELWTDHPRPEFHDFHLRLDAGLQPPGPDP